jgi:hypothetical protein
MGAEFGWREEGGLKREEEWRSGGEEETRGSKILGPETWAPGLGAPTIFLAIASNPLIIKKLRRSPMMQFYLLKPLVAILAFVIGVLAALPFLPSRVPPSKTKGYSESQVEFVNFYDLIEQRGKYDGHVVRLRARTGHDVGETGLYDIGGGDRKYTTNLSFVCGDSEKCRTVARYDRDTLIDLDLVVTGVFYAGTEPFPVPVLKITEINGMSEYAGLGGSGASTGER